MKTAVKTDTFKNPRAWLHAEMLRRQEQNPAFSLRSMARLLKIAPGTLSAILNGKRPLTERTILRLSSALCLSPEESFALLRGLGERRGKPMQRAQSTRVSRERFILEADQFRLISDWYHFAILSLTEVRGSQACPTWIARRLGISPNDAAQAMERLERLGILEIKNQRMRQISPPLRTQSEVPDAAIRKHHAENLEKAKRSLNEDPVSERHFCSMTVAVNLENMPRAKAAIEKFRDDLCGLLEAGTPARDRVYTYSFQLFPVDHGAASERSGTIDAAVM